MKVLWIVNLVFPEAQELLSGEGTLKASGGWLIGSANALIERSNVNLTVATVSKDVKKLTRLSGSQITYYLLPYGRGNKRINSEYEKLWTKVYDEVRPDVTHIHGTEYSHGLAFIEACGVEHVCVSIQGLVFSCCNYYYTGLSKYDIISSSTFASLIKGGILKGRRDFYRRGEYEKEVIRRVHHIIGRTSWDRALTWAINPDVTYHHGGETLRTVFYQEPLWKYDRCVKHSIFISQSEMPLKGLHQVLRALPIVLRHYPDTILRIAGHDITRSKSYFDRIKLSDWGNIVRKLIKRNNLHGCVCFTGPLDGESMKHEYLRSNVFICSSSIENSPNSLGEAQMLGVPVLASYVGGVPDMMKGDEEHVYRFEDFEVLASKICELFAKEGTIDTSAMREFAVSRHDSKKNSQELLAIYNMIVNE